MKIILNLDVLYRLMREHDIKTIRQLANESGMSEQALYCSLRRKTLSKETYWKLAEFFGCHVEDLQIMTYVKKDYS